MSAPPAAPRTRRFAHTLTIGQSWQRRDGVRGTIAQIHRKDREVMLITERGTRLFVDFGVLRRKWTKV